MGSFAIFTWPCVNPYLYLYLRNGSTCSASSSSLSSLKLEHGGTTPLELGMMGRDRGGEDRNPGVARGLATGIELLPFQRAATLLAAHLTLRTPWPAAPLPSNAARTRTAATLLLPCIPAGSGGPSGASCQTKLCPFAASRAQEPEPIVAVLHQMLERRLRELLGPPPLD
jgi:hypothetical protein